MPELPEVTTTVSGLNEVLPHLIIKDVWSDYYIKTSNKRADNIKNKKYFDKFRKEIIGEKFKTAERRGKNVLIHLNNKRTILIHMKMTGHLLYGKYMKVEGKDGWVAHEKGLLRDPFNRFIHLVFTLSNGKHLAFSDMRKFAKVIIFETENRNSHVDLVNLGPEPLDSLTLQTFKIQLQKKPKGLIKTVLMDQTTIAGIGNIYSDEILWDAGINPERRVSDIKGFEIKGMWRATKNILKKSIKMGGDSMSDYRNIYGEKGLFQDSHKAYRRTREKCLKSGCSGVIQRKVIGGRSSHYCSIHQK